MSEGAKEIGQLAALEAALYAAGRPVDINNLKKVLRTKSTKIVLKLVRKLREKYEQRQSALEVKELPGNRVILQLRTEFSKAVRRVTNRPLLTSGPLKTLSYIAYRQPVLQKHVIEARGGHAYAHIKTLKDMSLIEWIKEGKTRIIKTTDYFADYFGLSHDPRLMKQQLRRLFDNITEKTETNMRQENETFDVR